MSARLLREWIGMMIGALEYRCGRRLPDPDCAARLYSVTFHRRCGWLAVAMDDEHHGRPFRGPAAVEAGARDAALEEIAGMHDEQNRVLGYLPFSDRAKWHKEWADKIREMKGGR